MADLFSIYSVPEVFSRNDTLQNDLAMLPQASALPASI